MRTLVVGDLHFRSTMGYSDYVKDGRVKEKREVLDFIVDSANDCEGVILLGDCFNNRNNPSEVIREFVAFIERFKSKQVYIIAGNHCKSGDGKTALDFLKEINKPNWHIITNTIEKIGDFVFLPYFYKGEVKAANSNDLKNYIMKKLPEGKFLFCHHAISDMSMGHLMTNDLSEVVLPKEKLREKNYSKVFAGHIHSHSVSEDFFVTFMGSVFTNETGESRKVICKLTDNELGTECHYLDLPCRPIVTLENPSVEAVWSEDKDSIIKVVFNNRELISSVAGIKEALEANKLNFKIIEQYREQRVKKEEDLNIIDLSIEKLLKIYSTQKKVDYKALIEGFDIIK